MGISVVQKMVWELPAPTAPGGSRGGEATVLYQLLGPRCCVASDPDDQDQRQISSGGVSVSCGVKK